MAKPGRTFRLVSDVRAEAPRRGEVRITSAITSYKWDDDDVTANDFHRQLEDLGELDEIVVRINSPGGAVSQAVAIRSELMRMKAKKVIEIEGMCASAATIIACMPGAVVRMAEGSEYMIHRCLYGAWGHADDLLAAYNSTVATDKNIADIYAARTGKSAEECLELMTRETWMRPQEALEAGFIDEVVVPGAEEFEIAACADLTAMGAVMQECYRNLPEDLAERFGETGNRETGETGETGETEDRGTGEERGTEMSAGNEDRNGKSTVADDASENSSGGVETMDELRNATAEALQTENPELMQSIQNNAVTAERERVKKINALTRRGEKWEAMAKKAIEDGTSAAEYLEAVIAEESRAHAEYLESRRAETEPAARVGGGDSGDNDGKDDSAASDKLAKELAGMADGMRPTSVSLA